MIQKNVQFRTAVIGHTGRGNYGHSLDVALLGLDEVEIVAVADPDEAGQSAAQARLGAPRAYGDYREMLERERPNLVVVAPRVVGERVAMVTAAAEVGAHLFVEKPFAPCLADADRMLAAAEQAGVKVLVAHQHRLHPRALHAARLVREGSLGRLRLIRTYGKMDHRGGGQDLMVLGTHVLELMRFFAGEASWASGELFAGSRLVEPRDVREGDEEIGLIAGDGLRATFGFANGVLGFFESFVNLGKNDEPFGLDLVGETGQLALRGDFNQPLWRCGDAYDVPGSQSHRWDLVDVPNVEAGDGPNAEVATDDDVFVPANQRLLRDLFVAIAEDREPAASGADARAALELIQAVAAAHVAGGRVQLPLVERAHPLAAFKQSSVG